MLHTMYKLIKNIGVYIQIVPLRFARSDLTLYNAEISTFFFVLPILKHYIGLYFLRKHHFIS